MIPILDMWLAGETFRFEGDPASSNSIVGFKPAFNWQENGPSGGIPSNASVIAGMINELSLGSIQYIYVIQNTPFASLVNMVSMLAPHVELVGYEQLVDVAKQAEARKRAL